MSGPSPFVTAHAIALWWFNVSPVKRFREVMGSNHPPEYVDEKIATWGALGGFHLVWGTLDYKRQQRLVDAALAAYGAEGEIAESYARRANA